MSNSHAPVVKNDGNEYFSVRYTFKKGLLPPQVIGSLCKDPRYCRSTDHDKLMIRADAVWLIKRHGAQVIQD
jgi:hypothetical protein